MQNKRMIYTPGEFEQMPLGAVPYYLPIAGAPVIDVIVPEDFTTSGIVFYDSLNGPMLGEPFYHHFEGWRVSEEERIMLLSGG